MEHEKEISSCKEFIHPSLEEPRHSLGVADGFGFIEKFFGAQSDNPRRFPSIEQPREPFLPITSQQFPSFPRHCLRGNSLRKATRSLLCAKRFRVCCILCSRNHKKTNNSVLFPFSRTFCLQIMFSTVMSRGYSKSCCS